jgi:hypothetical protein
VASAFEAGVLAGVLVGEGHFGGDGRQPQITLRMHIRHTGLFAWIMATFPGGKLYGPYDHGGRAYYQWMARGPFLRDVMIPLLDQALPAIGDEWSTERYERMKQRYRLEPAEPAGDGTT